MTTPTPPDPSMLHYLKWRTALEEPALELDFSLSGLSPESLAALAEPLAQAHRAMAGLEGGAIANRDEDRQVGHYWLRNPTLAPDEATRDAIQRTADKVRELGRSIRGGQLAPPDCGAFGRVLVVGIGGSALGPMLLADALGGGRAGGPHGGLPVHVLDNTDPEGIDRTLAQLGGLTDTLVLVISKSGGTPETRNGLVEVEHALRAEGLELAPRAIAITGTGSKLDQRAEREGWLARLPLWDFVGGRTSVAGPVGMLPLELMGGDSEVFLRGMAAMDTATRQTDVHSNPAAMLAAWWHVQGNGRGDKAMVVLPYKDRLLLLSRYLQQLIMESLGKAEDRDRNIVHQGLTVYGNKGSTDQHAFVQQLRDGRPDFCALMVRVLADRDGPSPAVDDDGATAGEYLDGFLQGTRAALADSGRASVTLELEQLGDGELGAVVALFERAVGLYAELININAYHQPGVEAGKQAAASVLAVRKRLVNALDGNPRTCSELAALAGDPPIPAAQAWTILRHLATNRPEVTATGRDPETATFHRQG